MSTEHIPLGIIPAPVKGPIPEPPILVTTQTDEELEQEVSEQDDESLEAILFSDEHGTAQVKRKALKVLIMRALQDEYYWREL